MGKNYILDVNLIYYCAGEALSAGRYSDALALYLVLVRSDDSLDAGRLGYLLGQCYEKLGDSISAKFWAQRAEAENPHIEEYRKYRERFGEVDELAAETEIVSSLRSNYLDKLEFSKKLRDKFSNSEFVVWPPG
jgi:hypothetical protein